MGDIKINITLNPTSVDLTRTIVLVRSLDVSLLVDFYTQYLHLVIVSSEGINGVLKVDLGK